MLVAADDKNLFVDDSGVDFTPFQKVADKIEQCITLIRYHKLFNNIPELIEKENELKEYRNELKQIKKRIHR
ncbi:hypothetical protein NE686_18290 [Tissierella carlieri]|uniref:Uncharacterized protein n=1 Tax=Tissierella carlieri TaxID=689904 RepID=A0ABT1SFC1_9FIRM|nr:hypothetical protein [Tissierella carlieri]MCQ4925057.1 hypothetical protein [Tissierella carlieri]